MSFFEFNASDFGLGDTDDVPRSSGVKRSYNAHECRFCEIDPDTNCFECSMYGSK